MLDHPDTANRGVASWGGIFTDIAFAATVLDRLLLHKSVVFNIDGDSYRLRTHQAHDQQFHPKGGND